MIKFRGNAPWVLAAIVLSLGIAGCAGESGTGEQAAEEMPATETHSDMPAEMPADSAMADTAMTH